MVNRNERDHQKDPRHEIERLQILLDISQSLHRSINLDELLLYIMCKTKKLMDAEAVAVLLHDPATNEFFFRIPEASPNSHDMQLEEVRFPADKGIAAVVLKSGRPELLLNVANDPRHFRLVDKKTGFRTKSMVVVPLQTKERIIGVVEACNKLTGTFDEEDVHFLMMIASTVAMALDNARMYAELEKTHRELLLAHKSKEQLIATAIEENDSLRRELKGRYCVDQIVGNSPQVLEVFRYLERVVGSDITVLIEGETGTGKELLARCLHFNGPRKDKAFVVQNCGAIPESLLASELFGHRKGAFTGALSDKRGSFEVANGGTIFLDEVTEMSPAMQVSLLRALQEGDIKPVGADESKRVDVRVISATNKELEREVKGGRFREDLFYRLKVFSIRLPALREREDDIPVLAEHFMRKFNKKQNRSIRGFSEETLECLSAYPFPGNVRELENEIERAVMLAGDLEYIEIYHLSKRLRKASALAKCEPQTHGPLREMVESLEKRVLAELLEKHGGNKTKIAKESGLSRFGLMKKLKRYGL
jgi:transcriptional regulator with GAF, ATPase, and Fis domain